MPTPSSAYPQFGDPRHVTFELIRKWPKGQDLDKSTDTLVRESDLPYRTFQVMSIHDMTPDIMVDPDVLDLLTSLRWTRYKGYTGPHTRVAISPDEFVEVSMEHVIMGIPPTQKVRIRNKSGNYHDKRRSNLEIVTKPKPAKSLSPWSPPVRSARDWHERFVSRSERYGIRIPADGIDVFEVRLRRAGRDYSTRIRGDLSNAKDVRTALTSVLDFDYSKGYVWYTSHRHRNCFVRLSDRNLMAMASRLITFPMFPVFMPSGYPFGVRPTEDGKYDFSLTLNGIQLPPRTFEKTDSLADITQHCLVSVYRAFNSPRYNKLLRAPYLLKDSRGEVGFCGPVLYDPPWAGCHSYAKGAKALPTLPDLPINVIKRFEQIHPLSVHGVVNRPAPSSIPLLPESDEEEEPRRIPRVDTLGT